MSQKYSVPSYQTIFDALISISVPIENIVSVLNSSGYEIDVDFESISGVLQYETTDIVELSGGQKVIKPSSGTSKYLTNGTQNIFDVCLMTNGDINKLVLMVSQNEQYFNGVNSSVSGVFGVNFNNSDVTDSGFKTAVNKANINFTTGDVDGFDSGILLQENDGYILQEDGYDILY